MSGPHGYHHDMPLPFVQQSPLQLFENSIASVCLGFVLLAIFYRIEPHAFEPVLEVFRYLSHCCMHFIPASVQCRLKATSLRMISSSTSPLSLIGAPSLTPASPLETVQRSITTVSEGLFGRRGPSNGPAGLGNISNSCYQNSVLQGLASLRNLPKYLNLAITGPEDVDPSSTVGNLQLMIAELNSPENGGRQLWTRQKLKSMSTFQQQDAQEYYSRIIEDVDKDIAKAWLKRHRGSGLGTLVERNKESTRGLSEGKPDRSADATLSIDEMTVEQDENASLADKEEEQLKNPLEGLQVQRVACTKCGFSEGLSLIPFNCYTVPLGKEEKYTLQECLDEATKLEYIEGVECPKCTLLQAQSRLSSLLDKPEQEGVEPRPGALKKELEGRLDSVQTALAEETFSEHNLYNICRIAKTQRVSSTKSRQAVIARPPQSLVVHVNRSVFDEVTGMQRKNYAGVSFPQELDLSAWCLGGSIRDGGQSETWPLEPTTSLLSGKRPQPHALYDLRAIVTHYGRHENGHYVCFRQYARPVAGEKECPPSEEGKEGVDASKPPPETWWQLSDEDVSSIDESAVLAERGVFMLFYERKERDHSTQPIVWAEAYRTEDSLNAVAELDIDAIQNQCLKAFREGSVVSMDGSVTNLGILPDCDDPFDDDTDPLEHIRSYSSVFLAPSSKQSQTPSQQPTSDRHQDLPQDIVEPSASSAEFDTLHFAIPAASAFTSSINETKQPDAVSPDVRENDPSSFSIPQQQHIHDQYSGTARSRSFSHEKSSSTSTIIAAK